VKTSLPKDSQERKDVPMYSGCIAYFPAALAGVARHSKRGNDKHNKGQPLHHARGKSMDHEDCVVRHLTDIGDMVAAFERGPDVVDTDLILEEADALCWRALALSQKLHERFGNAPLAPAARAEPVASSEPAMLCSTLGALTTVPVMRCECETCTWLRAQATTGV
jgi:hypothetical protein